MIKTPKEEAELLLGAVLPFAEQQLQKYGEFFPFSAMLVNGEIQMLTTYDGDEHPESQKVIDDTEQMLTRRAKNGECEATALVYTAFIRNPETGKKEDAVCVNLDHKDDYTVTVVYTYLLDEKSNVQFFAPTAMKGEGKIFKKK